MNIWLVFLFLLVLGQRIVELRISKRNQQWMEEQGGYEIGKEHYPIILGVHLLLFIGILAEVVFFRTTPPSWWAVPLSIFFVTQGLRYWCIHSLGKYWSTRIWVVPGHSPQQVGPYRYLRHPNYLIVMIEILIFPFIFGAYFTSILVTIMNAFVILLLRVPREELALKEVTNYEKKMGDIRRFLPVWK